MLKRIPEHPSKSEALLTFGNTLFLPRVVNSLTKAQDEGPSLIGCLRMLMQHRKGTHP
jgi:hypothetical protein